MCLSKIQFTHTNSHTHSWCVFQKISLYTYSRCVFLKISLHTPTNSCTHSWCISKKSLYTQIACAAPTESTSWSLRCVLKIKNHTGACTHHTAYPNHVMLHHWHVLVNRTCSDYNKTHFSKITHALSTPTSFSEITHPLQSESWQHFLRSTAPPPPPHTHTPLPWDPPHSLHPRPLWDQTHTRSCPHLWDPESSPHRHGGSSWQWSKQKYRQGWWAATHNAPPLCPVNTSLTDYWLTTIIKSYRSASVINHHV